jgi:protein SCO1/2
MKTIFYSTSLALLVFFIVSNLKKNDLPILGQVKEFSFTNSDSSVFSSTRLNNKVWLFNLFFTSCQGPCPLITANLKNVYQQFVSNPDFAVVSLSVDPQRDLPDKLLAYANRFKLDPTRWFFIVGAEPVTREVALNSFQLGTPDDAKIHSNRVVLVDRLGNIRGYYLGIVPEDISKLEHDIKGLL